MPSLFAPFLADVSPLDLALLSVCVAADAALIAAAGVPALALAAVPTCVAAAAAAVPPAYASVAGFGPVVGKFASPTIARFLGIPYAASTAGANRWCVHLLLFFIVLFFFLTNFPSGRPPSRPPRGAPSAH